MSVERLGKLEPLYNLTTIRKKKKRRRNCDFDVLLTGVYKPVKLCMAYEPLLLYVKMCLHDN